MIGGNKTFSGSTRLQGSLRVGPEDARCVEIREGHIKFGRRDVGSNPIIDFLSGGLNADHDVRLLATGGNETPGQGHLRILAANGVRASGIIQTGPGSGQLAELHGGAGNHFLRLGRTDGTASLPRIEFRSNGGPLRDALIQASGGGEENDQGSLEIIARRRIRLSGPVVVDAKTAEIANDAHSFATEAQVSRHVPALAELARSLRTDNVGNTDCDTLVTTGAYAVSGTGINAPWSGGSAGLVFVMASGNIVIQLAKYHSDSSVPLWYRTRNSAGRWEPWKDVASAESAILMPSSGTFDNPVSRNNSAAAHISNESGEWINAFSMRHHSSWMTQIFTRMTSSEERLWFRRKFDSTEWSPARRLAFLDEVAAAGHTHNRADISDFPSSMPASDVHQWAKAANKPAYTANEVGAARADSVFGDRRSRTNYRVGTFLLACLAPAYSHGLSVWSSVFVYDAVSNNVPENYRYLLAHVSSGGVGAGISPSLTPLLTGGWRVAGMFAGECDSFSLPISDSRKLVLVCKIAD